MSNEAPKLPLGKKALNLLSLVVCCFGVFVHAMAGWLDEGRIVLRPVGHLTLLVVPTWLFSIIISAVAIVGMRGRGILSWCSFIIAVGGLGLLFTA